MSKHAQNIVTQLDGLSPAELSEIAAQATARAALLGGGSDFRADRGKAPTGLRDGDEAVVYDCMADAIRPWCGEVPSYAAFAKRHAAYPKFAAGVLRLADLVKRHFRPANAAERRKAYAYLCGLIVRHRTAVRRRSAKARPVDAFSFADDLNRVESIVEEQFPEYMPSGLLKILMRRELVA